MGIVGTAVVITNSGAFVETKSKTWNVRVTSELLTNCEHTAKKQVKAQSFGFSFDEHAL